VILSISGHPDTDNPDYRIAADLPSGLLVEYSEKAERMSTSSETARRVGIVNGCLRPVDFIIAMQISDRDTE